MAAGRRRRWLAIGGATAAVAIGTCAAIALGAPVFTAPALSRLPVNLSWSDAGATGFTLSRAPGTCGAGGQATDLPLTQPTDQSYADTPGDGHYCYAVTGTYADGPATSVADVWVDNTAPSVPAFTSIIFPGATLHGTVVLGATSSDLNNGSGMLSTTITINGVPFATGVSAASGPWAPSPDGDYTLAATSQDVAGNTTSTPPIVVRVDNTPPPPFSIFAPSPVAGSPTLAWPGTDSYSATRDGTSVGPVSSPWTDPGNPPPGPHTYVITATDGVGNQRQSSVTVLVLPLSATAPQALAAASPTNVVPHLTWQKPDAFPATSWQVFRDGNMIATVSGSNSTSFDDHGVPAEGPHVYTVRAVSDTTLGDPSGTVSVIYDTTPPTLAAATATANPDGSVSLGWPDASDPTPGSGITNYIVRRGTSPPSDVSSGTGVCTLIPPANACVDDAVKSGTNYGYTVFAVDAAGNKARREASAKAADSQAPEVVANFKVLTFDRTYARLTWTIPAFKGANEDVSGYRVIKLRAGVDTPLSPNDGTVVCRNDNPKDDLCDALKLTTGKKTTFAVYAFDEVPNYSAPAIVSMVPHSVDKKPPHKPTKVRVTRSGLTYTLKWLSPKDRDLSKFRVTIYDKGPAPNPKKGKVVGQGRVLHATFTLKPGKRTYVTLFALDVVGNFSKVSKLIVTPRTAVVPKSKKKKPAVKKTVKKPVVKKPAVKKPAEPSKPIPVEVTAKAANA